MSGSLEDPRTQPWENPMRPLPVWGLPSVGEADQGLGAHCPPWEALLRRTLADGGERALADGLQGGLPSASPGPPVPGVSADHVAMALRVHVSPGPACGQK